MVHRPIKDSIEMVGRVQEEHLVLDIYLAHSLLNNGIWSKISFIGSP